MIALMSKSLSCLPWLNHSKNCYRYPALQATNQKIKFQNNYPIHMLPRSFFLLVCKASMLYFLACRSLTLKYQWTCDYETRILTSWLRHLYQYPASIIDLLYRYHVHVSCMLSDLLHASLYCTSLWYPMLAFQGQREWTCMPWVSGYFA